MQRPTNAPDARVTFLKALGEWLQSRKYQLTIPIADIDVKQDYGWVVHAAEAAQAALNLAMPLVGGGFKYSADRLYDAIAPFVPLADTVAWQVNGGTNIVVPIIFADHIAPETLRQRIDHFLTLAQPLAEFGPRVYASSSATGNVVPLLVYFDAATYAQSLAVLLPHGGQAKSMQRLYLQTGFINIPEQSITWADRAGAVGWLTGIFGAKAKSQIGFETPELQTVLAIAQRYQT